MKLLFLTFQDIAKNLLTPDVPPDTNDNDENTTAPNHRRSQGSDPVALLRNHSIRRIHPKLEGYCQRPKSFVELGKKSY